MRSRIEPMKKIARSLRQHRELILNYFRAQKLLSSGVVEGLNNKAKVTMRKSYGFRTFRCLELALYHSLGKLPAGIDPRILLTNRNFIQLLDANAGTIQSPGSRRARRTQGDARHCIDGTWRGGAKTELGATHRRFKSEGSETTEGHF